MSELQARVDAVNWYHEFDFGNGVKARSNASDVEVHRRIWSFIERNLDTVDFKNKSVLDIGCWDGYWSFYAERRGAGSVLATDDHTQNWAARGGILLARELLESSVEVKQDVSVYKLAELNRKFDVIMFLGVYYHLFDPFYALAQIRHCCHDETVVVIEGVEAVSLRRGTALFNFLDHCCEWMPTVEAMEQVLGATYFNVISATSETAGDGPAKLPSIRWRLLMMKEIITNSRAGVHAVMGNLNMGARRIFMKCMPFEGEAEVHNYPPPFGLDQYDPRFRSL